MSLLWVVALSCIIQLIAATMALRLIPVTKHRLAWGLLSTALFLMTVRRIISFYHILFLDPHLTMDATQEWLGLVLSICMLIAVILIKPLFHEIEDKAASIEERKVLLDAFLDSSRNPLFSVDNSYCYTAFNSAHAEVMKALYGVDIELGRPLSAYMTVQEDWLKAKANIDKALEGEKLTEEAFSGDEARTRSYFTVTHDPIFEKGQGIVGVAVRVLDITDRKRTEEKLKINQQLLAETELIGKVGGWEFDIDTGKQNWTDEVYQIHELDTTFDPTVDTGISFYTPASQPIVEEAVKRAIEQGEPFDLDLEIITAKGNLRSVYVIGKTDLENRRVYGFFQDITNRKRLEQEAAFEKDAAQRYLDVSSVIIVSIAKSGDVSMINKYGAGKLGYKVEEIIGKNWFDIFVPAAERSAVKKVFKQIMRGDMSGAKSYENQVVAKDGSLRTIAWNNIYITDGEGKITESLSSGMDITERKKAEEEIVHLASFPQLNTMPIVEFSKEMEVVYTNPAMQNEIKRLGIKDVKQFLPPEWRKLLLKNGETEGRPLVYELQLAGRTFHESIVAVHGEKAIRIYALDITQRKQAEEELEMHRVRLEEMVKQRTEELEAFTYSVSHDLRAPLRSIDGFSQVVIEDYSAKLDEKALDYLFKVRAAAERMALMIDDLLILSRATQAEITVSQVNLSDLANEVAAFLRQTTPEKKVKITIQKNMTVWTDPILLRIVLENLFSNAWKFSAHRKTAEIELGCTTTPDRLLFEVRDNGVGFDPHYVDKLFVPFQRLHSQDDFPGTGVGLATVARIIHRLGGQVWAKGEQDSGATFGFSIPRTKSE